MLQEQDDVKMKQVWNQESFINNTWNEPLRVEQNEAILTESMTFESHGSHDGSYSIG